MANEAFALSPISARAALPSEEDYAAISEAFMETARGRWFLTEYAKRNRNADTRMVLDAVARIEQSLAAQKEDSLQQQESHHKEEALAAQQQAAEAAAAATAAKDSLTEALGAIRDAVEAAQESASEALDSLALEQRLAPVRKGARVLREIAWRLREIGNDGRICDLIDSQVAVIEKGAEQITAEEARVALEAAFAALEGRLAEFGDNDGAPAPAMAPEAAAPSPVQQEMPAAAVAETIDAPPPMAEATEAPSVAFEAPSGALAASAGTALAEAEAVHAEAAEAPAAAELTGEAADAHDEALLDMIAMEMGAPDPISDDEIAAAVAEEVRAHQPAPVEPEIVAVAPAPETRPIAPPVREAFAPPPRPTAVIEPVAPREVSLGSTIIASGMLRKPATAANDPLAPIRRMSQAEKIAFFS
jgi:hypothetical protein